MNKMYPLLLSLLITGLGFAQTTIYNENGGGSAPTGWTFQNNVTPNTIDRGSYWLVDAGNPSDFIITDTFDLSSYTDAEFTLDVASFSSGTYHPAKIEISFDGGSNYTQTETSTTTTGSSYINGGTFTLNSVSSQVVIRISNNGTSGRGVRLRNLELTASGVASGCTAPFQASSFMVSTVNTTDAILDITRGGGNDILVVMKEGSAVDTDPTSGITYTANSIFGGIGASEIGIGNFVVFNGNDGTSNPGIGGANLSVPVSGLTPNTVYHLAFYEYNTVGTCYQLDELSESFTTDPVTTVQFTGTSTFVPEDVGTYDLVIEIANEDAVATTFDVVLTSGDAADIDSFTTQSESFPGSSTTNITVTITVTDDAIQESNEIFSFEIQNVAGGNSAMVGANNTFDLTILANDAPVIPGLLYDADFSNDGDGFPAHTTSSPPASAPASAGPFGTAPNSWFLSYDTVPNSDGSDNIFEVVSGALLADDWGGQGIFTSQVIDVTSINTVDISATGIDIDANQDEFTYFYILDGGSRVETPVASNDGDPVNYSIVGLDVSGTSSLEVGFEFSENGGGQGYSVSEFMVNEGASETSVQFSTTSANVEENDGTYDLIIEITNEDAAATTFDVVLTSGDAADIDSYTTQSESFPGGSATNVTVTVTITDDAILEGDETLTFEIQNVAGGDNAVVGLNNTFDLTILASDAPIPDTIWSEPFTDNSLYSVTLGGEGNDGTSDYFQITDGSNINKLYTGNTGNFFAGQDIDDGGWSGSASPSQLTWTGIDVENYTSLNFSGSFASEGGGIDSSDNLLIQYQIDGGGWNDLLEFNNSGGFNNSFFEDTDFDGTGDGTQLFNTFAEFEKSIPTTGTTLDLRVTISIDSGDEEIALEHFKLEGTPPFTYTYTAGTWSPSNPNGVSTASQNIIIASGNATIDNNTTANSVTVNAGAALTIDTGITLTASNGLDLESTSTSYSSLILNGNITGTVKYNRYVNSNAPINGNDLISAPVSGQAFNTFIANNPNIRTNPSGPEVLFGGFDNDNSTDPYELWNENDTTPLTAGKGYRSGITEGEPSNLVTFEGSINNSLVQIAIDQGSASKLNLIGNPFPSYLDAQQFLTHNMDVLDPSAAVIYGYNDSTDGASAGDYTIISALLNTDLDIAPGQGFFIASDATGGNIEFTTSTPDMRLAAGGDDFIAGRNATDVSNLKLNLSNTTDNFITNIFFTQNSGQGLDPGYDASLLGGSAPSFALYSHLVQDNTNIPFAVQALSQTDYVDVTVSLGINANQGEQLTFSISESNLPSSVEIYLDDTVANTSTLLNTSDYILTPNTDFNGTGRFYLRFTQSTLSTLNPSLDNLSIYSNKSDKTIVVAGQLIEATRAKLYDIQGRLVNTTFLENTTRLHTIDVSNLNAGVYVIQLEYGLFNKTQKVVIH